MHSRRLSIPLPFLMLAIALAVATGARAQRGEAPPGIPVPGFEQLLPRGGIPALVDPLFVPAAQAKMPDDAWVLGFVTDGGEAYAYDLNLLNSHEVVNHTAGGAPIAAVWWPLANTAVVYSRQSQDGDTTYTFEPSGGLLNASLVMQDRESDSYWSIITDSAIYGAAKGERLHQVPGSVKTTFGAWKAEHPTTKVLSVGGVEHSPQAPYDRYFASDRGFRGLGAQDDRLADKALLFGFHRDGKAYAVPFSAFEKGGAALGAGDRALFVFRRKDDSFYRSTVAFAAAPGVVIERKGKRWRALRDGEEVAIFDAKARRFEPGGAVEPVTGFDTYWYIWSLNNPQTEVLE